MDDQLEPPPRSIFEFATQWREWLFKLYKYVYGNMNKDFFFEVSQGNVRGYTSRIIRGSNPDVDTTEEDIWNAGGSFVYLTAADTFRIAAGGNAADTAAGTGARSVTFEFLDANYNTVTEVIATAGAAASAATTSTGLRFQSAYVTTVGTNGKNVGNITIQAVTAATTQSVILAGEGIANSGIYTIPANKTGFVLGENFSIVKAAGGPGTGSAGVQIFGWVRNYDTASTNNYQSWLEVFHVGIIEAGNNPPQIKEFIGRPLIEKSDIRVSAISDTTNMHVDARLYFVLKDN